ncbi:MAG: (Fe-S)-binding protein [Chloroflexi bacterium]|nr:(Fe-S)-binding protein [Chloroflexota bacterium]
MPPDLNGRLDFWNIGYPLGALVYLSALVAVVAVAWALYGRSRIWRLGAPDPDAGPWGPRVRAGLRTLLAEGFGHRRLVRHERYPGVMHALIFWGIAVLFVATTLAAVEFNVERYAGWVFPTALIGVQLELVWDLGGLMLLAGIGLAAYRRYVIRPPRLNTMLENGVLLWALLAMALSGFVLQALRMAATEMEPTSVLYHPEWAAWSPVSYSIAFGLRASGMTLYAMEVSHFVLWWAHAALFSATFVYAAVRFGPLMHIFVSPLSLLMRTSLTRPKGALRPMGALESLESFGARDLGQLTTKQLLDFDACTNCGRCEDQCPAFASGKPLSPRRVIQDAKAYMEYRAPALLAAAGGEPAADPERSLVHDFIGPDALWACTTCGACEEACPAGVEHIDTIVDMRRFLTMEEAAAPQTAMDAMASMEQRGHPWRGTQATRTDWMEGTGAVTMAEDPEHEVLLWVGCTTALNTRNQAAARAMAAVLKRAGVRYRVLGNEEACTGDPARRMGNEYLYQTLAEQNIATMQGYGVKKVLTLCPHCFNTIKNEYPQLGGNFEVLHYTEYVAELVREGRIKPVARIEATVAYHDSCYLGRHNGIYDPPREIAEAIPGLTLVEMGEDRCRERGFCCGAGGGRMWMEEEGTRVNHIRTDHFLETGADIVGVSCPFCLQMMEEGIGAKGMGDTKQAKDLLELLAESLDGPQSG